MADRFDVERYKMSLDDAWKLINSDKPVSLQLLNRSMDYESFLLLMGMLINSTLSVNADDEMAKINKTLVSEYYIIEIMLNHTSIKRIPTIVKSWIYSYFRKSNYFRATIERIEYIDITDEFIRSNLEYNGAMMNCINVKTP